MSGNRDDIRASRENGGALLSITRKEDGNNLLQTTAGGLMSSLLLSLLRGPVIVVQHTAQSLASLDRSVELCQTGLRNNQLIAETLVIPFKVVMCCEFPDRLPQRALPEKDQSIQARFLARPHKAFRMGIQVWRTGRKFHRLNSHLREHKLELRREQRVAIMDQIPLTQEETIHRVADISGYLAHP